MVKGTLRCILDLLLENHRLEKNLKVDMIRILKDTDIKRKETQEIT